MMRPIWITSMSTRCSMGWSRRRGLGNTRHFGDVWRRVYILRLACVGVLEHALRLLKTGWYQMASVPDRLARGRVA
jgi:hypothetical protein